jgi:hypothetical protein
MLPMLAFAKMYNGAGGGGQLSEMMMKQMATCFLQSAFSAAAPSSAEMMQQAAAPSSAAAPSATIDPNVPDPYANRLASSDSQAGRRKIIIDILKKVNKVELPWVTKKAAKIRGGVKDADESKSANINKHKKKFNKQKKMISILCAFNLMQETVGTELKFTRNSYLYCNEIEQIADLLVEHMDEETIQEWKSFNNHSESNPYRISFIVAQQHLIPSKFKKLIEETATCVWCLSEHGQVLGDDGPSGIYLDFYKLLCQVGVCISKIDHEAVKSGKVYTQGGQKKQSNQSTHSANK